MTASGGVKIPPDWLHEPHFQQRSELLEARKLERRHVALDAERTHAPRHHAGNRSFAHVESITRDTYRKCGAFDLSNVPPLDPLQFHARATRSDASTRSALLNGRLAQRRSESLTFEPHDLARLRGIPTATQLREWWREPRNGYVADPPAAVSATSLRLALGPVDPAKVRCPASVDERREHQVRKAQLADKVSHIVHSVPAAYLKSDYGDAATIPRASDLYAQERSSGSGFVSSGALARAKSLPPAFPPVSPIRVLPSPSQPQHRNHRVRPSSVAIERLVDARTHERTLLEQLKSCTSPIAVHGNHQQQQQQSQRAVTSDGPSLLPSTRGVRCGGFS